jgi:hypothetical protein
MIVMPMILHRKRPQTQARLVKYASHNQKDQAALPILQELKARLLVHNVSLMQSGVGGRPRRLHCLSAVP